MIDDAEPTSTFGISRGDPARVCRLRRSTLAVLHRHLLAVVHEEPLDLLAATALQRLTLGRRALNV